MPGLCVIGTPGKRRAILELASEADRRGYPALVVGLQGAMPMCLSLLHVTHQATVWTGIQPIYTQHAAELGFAAAHLAEVGGGRFRLGIGVSHGRSMDRLGIPTGKPLADVRAYVEGLHRGERRGGELPPIVLATLRDKMLDLAMEVADGAMWANAALSYMPEQLARIPEARRGSFELSCMLPTVIDDDRVAARAVHRRTLVSYVTLPNYRNYWKLAGYVEEMEAIEAALEAGERDRLPELMPDHWVDDCTVSGSAAQVRDRFAEWHALGVLPVAVMSSTTGGQSKAIGELLATYA